MAESFYSTMRVHSRGQHNDTKLSWSLPALQLCDDIIRDGVKIYFEGDGATIKPHKSTIFSSTRARNYQVSKVVDRVSTNKGRCPFLGQISKYLFLLLKSQTFSFVTKITFS